MDVQLESKLARRMLYLAVFSSGMTTLAVELTASRLLGNVFGTSNLIWANVIGLILLYLTAGYFVGGWLADRSPRAITMYRIIAWGAFFSGLVPLVARPVLQAASSAVSGFQAGIAIGSFIAVLVLFSIPITLLGCVSPFAIRLAVSGVQESGKVSGRIYAISTLGSLLGTFLPVLYFIPEVGTARTFLYFSGYLLAISLIGLLIEGGRGRRAALQLAWMPIVLIVLSLIVLNGPLRPPLTGTSLLYEKDSPYNYIQVAQLDSAFGRDVNGQFITQLDKGARILLLNEGQGWHSVWRPGGGFYGGTWDMFLTAPFFNAPPYGPDDVKSMAIIGLAAGTISTQYTDVVGPDVQIDGIEIDPQIVEVGRQYFGMTQPNLNVIVEDGRAGLQRSAKRYDVVAIDAYRVPYVPWHMTTLEFFREVRDHLTMRGVAVINVGRTVNSTAGTQDRRLIEAMTNTMQQVFPTVHTIDVEDSFNTILVATLQPTVPANLMANLTALPANTSPLLAQAILTANRSLRPTVASDVLFTDDRTSVESIVNEMLVEFLTGGGPQQFSR
jgi:predicted membrane-bound spermidine synthase